MKRDVPRFVQTAWVVPPGGAWFFQMGDDKVASPVYEIALKGVGEILAKHGVKTPAPQALAEFMCPHMPPGFCAGPVAHSPAITGKMAADKAERYFYRRLVPVDEVMRRMDVCLRCKAHRRDFCLSCAGWPSWISGKFNNRRPVLPVDTASGCCSCAGTFEAVIASVEYDKDEAVWEGAPETCWRRQCK